MPSGRKNTFPVKNTISAVEETEFPVVTQFASYCDSGTFAPFFEDAPGDPKSIYCDSRDLNRRSSSGNESSVVLIRNPLLCVEKGEIVIFAIDTSMYYYQVPTYEVP